MAIVKIPDSNQTLSGIEPVTTRLAAAGIEYERWDLAQRVPAGASSGEILAAYASEIEALKARGGYVTADVIDVTPETPGLEAMLAKFNREHWHDEDEIRFIVEGRGVFHIHAQNQPILAIEVEAGDMIRVPAGTWHWFDLCADRRIRAIRLFQDPSGWAPHYTNSGVDQGYQPVCMGSAYFPVSA